MKKSIPIFLLASILLQSCVIYSKTSIPIEEAIDGIKVRVKPTAVVGDNIRFKEIVFRDSVYYGIRGGVETPLYQDQIFGIYPQDKKKSRLITAIVLVSYFVVFPILFAWGLSKADWEDLNIL